MGITILNKIIERKSYNKIFGTGAFKVRAKLCIDAKRGLVYYRIDSEAERLMLWYVGAVTKAEFAKPRAGAHTTIINKKFDKFDLKKIKKLKLKKEITIEINWVSVRIQNTSKDFWGVYGAYTNDYILDVRKSLGLEVKKFWAHITFCSTKGVKENKWVNKNMLTFL